MGGFFAVAFLVVSFVVTFMVWPRIIAKRVQAFCDTVSIGEGIDSLPIRAKASGLMVHLNPPFTTDQKKPESILQYSDGVGFERYYCTLESLEGKVSSKRFSHSD